MMIKVVLSKLMNTRQKKNVIVKVALKYVDVDIYEFKVYL